MANLRFFNELCVSTNFLWVSIFCSFTLIIAFSEFIIRFYCFIWYVFFIRDRSSILKKLSQSYFSLWKLLIFYLIIDCSVFTFYDFLIFYSFCFIFCYFISWLCLMLCYRIQLAYLCLMENIKAFTLVFLRISSYFFSLMSSNLFYFYWSVS